MSTEYATGGAPSSDDPQPPRASWITRASRRSRWATQARARTREQVDQRSSELGTRASSVAEDLRSVAEHLRSQGKTGPAGLVEQAAQRVAGAGDYLQGTDGNQILHDVESLGRRRPWTAIAGGLAAGIAASRLLKASSTDRYRTGGPRRPLGCRTRAPRPQTRLPRDEVVEPGTAPRHRRRSRR